MQALEKNIQRVPAKLLVFPSPMAKSPWTRNQLLSLAGIVVGGLLTLGLGILTYLTYSDTHAQAKQSNLDDAIDLRLNKNQKLSEISSKMDDVLSRLSDLEGWRKGITSQVKIVQDNQSKLSTRLDQNISLARVQNPDQTLAFIKATLKTADESKRVLPASDVIDYKNSVALLPSSSRGYWETLAAVVNYRSFVDQIGGHAPDPEKVSRMCTLFSQQDDRGNVSFGNTVEGGTVHNCVVDLDSQRYIGVVFINCVVRYNGGPTQIKNVKFVNCRFLLNLASTKTPVGRNFLFAILNSSQQTQVDVPGS
jgi:hypothetical protein